MKTRAIRMAKQGAPEVLVLEDVEVPAPGPGQALVRQTAVGLNFLDVYHRSGAYPLPVPSGVGSEGAGVVEAVGEGVTSLSPGDRVAYQGGEIGSYAAHRVMPVARLVKLPDGVSDDVAASIMLKGMTVEYLLDRCAPLKGGDFALTYAAAGGVGLLMGQWAKARGIRLIGVAAGPEKCALARANGYFAVLDRKTDDIVAKVKEITGGKGVVAVFDSVGKETFETSLDCLAPRGYFVSFGATTGAPPPVEAATLQKRGSLFFTRPTLVTYSGDLADYSASAKTVLDMVATGRLKPHIGQRYPLAQAAQAHRDLEAGRTIGSTLLIP